MLNFIDVWKPVFIVYFIDAFINNEIEEVKAILRTVIWYKCNKDSWKRYDFRASSKVAVNFILYILEMNNHSNTYTVTTIYLIEFKELCLNDAQSQCDTL